MQGLYNQISMKPKAIRHARNASYTNSRQMQLWGSCVLRLRRRVTGELAHGSAAYCWAESTVRSLS